MRLLGTGPAKTGEDGEDATLPLLFFNSSPLLSAPRPTPSPRVGLRMVRRGQTDFRPGAFTDKNRGLLMRIHTQHRDGVRTKNNTDPKCALSFVPVKKLEKEHKEKIQQRTPFQGLNGPFIVLN